MADTLITVEVHEIGSAGATKLIQSLLDEPPVAFVGSGISLWEPSLMPTGQDFTASLFSLLFDSCFSMQADEQSIIHQLFNEMPFEHILEVCPNPAAAADLIFDLYGKDTPNPIHQAFAKALRESKINSLITTNYDCCIETALNQTAGSLVEKIVTEEDWSKVTSSSTLYFKIHGSSELGLKETAIKTLAEECLLPAWKRLVLEHLLRGNTVVFVGYSGRDFELCPEIERISPHRIVWITRSPLPPSVNAKALLHKTNSYILHGDLNLILGQWLESAPATLTKDMAAATRQSIQSRFTHDQFVEWRLAILIRIGAPALAERTLNSARVIDPIVRLRQRAHMEILAGCCHQAARHFLQASLRLYRSQGRGPAADVLLDACDAYRIYGAMVRAWLTFACAALIGDEGSRAKMFLKLGLLIFAAQGFLTSKWLRSLRRWLRNSSKVVLKKCATESLATGNWLDFQQAGLLAKRMGIERSELAEGSFYPPPDPSEGYLKLGYFMAQSMMVLDDLEAHPPENRSEVQRSELGVSLLRQLQFCDVLGIAPQAWKLRAAGRKCFELQQQAERQYIDKMIEDFRACEFRFVMRRYWQRRFPFLNAALRNGS